MKIYFNDINKQAIFLYIILILLSNIDEDLNLCYSKVKHYSK